VAFDEGLAERIRMLTGPDPLLSERKMFDGQCFMISVDMAFGIVGDYLMVRVGPSTYDEAALRPHVREMDFTGRTARGLVYLDPVGFSEDDALDEWLQLGAVFAASLPPSECDLSAPTECPRRVEGKGCCCCRFRVTVWVP
jgi:hypothetical protein